jgi:hypothetical protein
MAVCRSIDELGLEGAVASIEEHGDSVAANRQVERAVSVQVADRDRFCASGGPVVTLRLEPAISSIEENGNDPMVRVRSR